MIRVCQSSDTETIYAIVNAAARAYEGFIPADCYHQPYMPLDELRAEMERMTFYGWEEEGELTGVMGYEPVRDVSLIRHAYVLPDRQGWGIGHALLTHIIGLADSGRLLVGTWADAYWAVAFYEKHGFSLLPDKDELLRTYWDISPRQVETSVVLGIDIG